MWVLACALVPHPLGGYLGVSALFEARNCTEGSSATAMLEGYTPVASKALLTQQLLLGTTVILGLTHSVC